MVSLMSNLVILEAIHAPREQTLRQCMELTSSTDVQHVLS
jgi:hypothetical protein